MQGDDSLILFIDCVRIAKVGGNKGCGGVHSVRIPTTCRHVFHVHDTQKYSMCFSSNVAETHPTGVQGRTVQCAMCIQYFIRNIFR